MVKLDEVAKERRKSIKTDKANMPIVGLEHLIPQQIQLTEWSEDTENTFTKVFHKGDILFGRRRAYLKKAALAPFDGICSGDITVIAPIENKIVPKLLPFIIQNDDFFDYAVEKSAGSLSPRVKWEHLKNYEFELPSLEEQKKLAKILWAAEETKQAYKTLLKKTDDMVKAKFEEMFGDPIKNDKNWQYSFLPDVTTIVLGSTPRTNVSEYWNGDIKWVTPAELKDDTFIVNDTVKHISERGKTSANLTLFPKNTVIFSTRAPIGKTAIAGHPMCCNQGFKNFICSEHINHIYLYYVLKNNKDYFISLGTGTTFKELPKTKIEKIAISIPPILQQKEFESLYLQAEQSKQQLQKSLDSLNASMRALINENLK
jgi:type I restriction enzyme S subunit